MKRPIVLKLSSEELRLLIDLVDEGDLHGMPGAAQMLRRLMKFAKRAEVSQ